MNEHPILFSGPMVNAVMQGSKTHTRRVMKPQPLSTEISVPFSGAKPCVWFHFDANTSAKIDWCRQYGRPYIRNRRFLRWNKKPAKWGKREVISICPYGKLGDILWVKETFRFWLGHDGNFIFRYRADDAVVETNMFSSSEDLGYIEDYNTYKEPEEWRSPLFMPLWASRLTLLIIDVGMERLQDITEDDAIAEGIVPVTQRGGGYVAGSAVNGFRYLWNLMNGKRPGCTWEYNPWVWVIKFIRVQT
jgi:hypothetical protein